MYHMTKDYPLILMEDTVAGKRTMNHTRSAVHALLALFVVAAVSLLLSFALVPQLPDAAWAAIYPVEESGQAQSPDGGSAANGERIADDETPMASGLDEESDEAASEEQIDDDETPLSEGLGAAEPVFSNSFAGIVLAGIVVVAVFFMMLTRRLNSNINDMRRKMH